MSAAIRLPRKFDAQAARTFIQDVKSQALSDIVLDATDLELIGGMGVQALLVCGAELDSQGFRLSVEHLSEDVSATLSMIGISPEAIAKGEIA